MSKYLAVDVGGTNVKYALMDENAQIFDKGEYPTPVEGGLEEFINSLKTVYDKYANEVEALVMSAPGKIDAHNGYFYTSGALGYISGVNLRDRLKDIIPVPFAVENDAKAAALAEIWKGSMQGVKNGIVLVLGTGIGGAIIIDGKLYRGTTFAAGEFSGITTRLDQFPYVPRSMWAQQNGVGYLVIDYANRINAEPTRMNGRILFDAANKGDQNALDAIDHFNEGVAAGIVALQFALDVEKVAVGGGISKQPLLMDSLRNKLEEYYATAVGMPATLPEVVSCTFGNDANMIGALYHYLHEMGE